jgi:hypothetical protein
MSKKYQIQNTTRLNLHISEHFVTKPTQKNFSEMQYLRQPTLKFVSKFCQPLSV